MAIGNGRTCTYCIRLYADTDESRVCKERGWATNERVSPCAASFYILSFALSLSLSPSLASLASRMHDQDHYLSIAVAVASQG